METPLLDNRDALLEIDTRGTLASIEQLGDQVQDVWSTAESLDQTPSSDATKVVVAGMGGSILGTHIIQTLFADALEVPILIAPDYSLPNYVDEQTLVIASSYSGTTAETVAAIKDAINKGATLSGITTGGEIAKILTSQNAPFLQITPTHNPCNVPRMGLGYSIFGQIALFAKLGLLELTDEMYRDVLTAIAAAQLKYSVAVDQEQNAAKLLAYELHEQFPLIISSEHIEGAAHVFSNQINENSKQLSTYFTIPELNHHLLEGILYPKTSEFSAVTVTIHSNAYAEENQDRLQLTETLFEKHSIKTRALALTAKSKLGQVFELLTFSSYVSYYLAMLNNVSPGETPQVEWFKSTLQTS